MTSKEQTAFIQELERVMRRLDDTTLDKLRDLIWQETIDRNIGDKENDNI